MGQEANGVLALSAPARSEVPWESLSASARDALIEVAKLLIAERFTGAIHLNCNEGGVTNWQETRTRQPRR